MVRRVWDDGTWDEVTKRNQDRRPGDAAARALEEVQQDIDNDGSETRTATLTVVSSEELQ